MIKPNDQVEILTANGEHVKLSSLWETGPAILVFVRHFG
jgi:hypothetical protein